MNRAPRCILLEFNELCPRLIEQFMAQGHLPGFRRLFESSQIYITDAAESPPNLEPWIQWVTVHTGMQFEDHQVFHLGDGCTLKDAGVGRVLSDAGVRVGVLGSMNTNYSGLNGYFIPDPWDKKGRAEPECLATYYRVVSKQVQESSGDKSLGLADVAQFGWFMARHGISPSTALAVIRQLVSEKLQPGVAWRRACVLEHLQYDLFRHLNKRFGVQFATLFCNSTAHFQHYHWRNMQPELFDQPPSADDHRSLADAILVGYKTMDRLVCRVLDDYPHALVLMCTALSQQPWTDTAKCTYRPQSFDALLKFAGLQPSRLCIAPVMAEEFHIECRTSQDADSAEARLRELRVDSASLMRIERNGLHLFAACGINEAGAEESLVIRASDGSKRRFGDLFHIVHSMRSGRHHPDGMLWIRSGQHRIHTEKVQLTDIAPTILHCFDVDQPSHMSGRSLLSEQECTLSS